MKHLTIHIEIHTVQTNLYNTNRIYTMHEAMWSTKYLFGYKLSIIQGNIRGFYL